MRGTLLFGPFRLDVAARQLWRGNELIPLAPKSFDLLEHLAEHAGELQTREQLFAALWPDTWVDDHALSVQIREIRKALGDSVQDPHYIATRHRRGYCFKAQVMRAADARAGAASPGISGVTAPAPVPETHYARSGDTNIAYQVIGEGPVDVVFVMGWISHLEYFWTEPRFARFLRRLSMFSRLILFDKRGTGMSDRVPVRSLPTIEQRMDDLRAVMRAARSERAVLCGISEGGCMSAVFAATHPGSTIALILLGSYARRLRAPDYPWGPSLEEREEFLREIRDNWGGPIGLEERAPSLANDPQFREWWATYLRMGASPGAAQALTQMNSEVDIRDILPSIRIPTLVIHRSGDPCLKVQEGRYLAERIPGARFLELPGIDHLPFVGDQDAILDGIEAFVGEVAQGLAHDTSLATVLVARIAPRDGAGGDIEAVNREIRAELARFRAMIIQAIPFGLVAAFDGPARGVRAAVAIRDCAAQLGWLSSAGLHTGECVTANPDRVHGTAAEIAERIQATAQPGEVVVSGTLRDLVAGSGLRFERCGRVDSGELGEWQLLRLCS